MNVLALLTLAALVVAWHFIVRHMPEFHGSLGDRLRALRYDAEVGALTLVEAAKLSRDDLQRGVIETFVQVSPILDRLPFIGVEGNAYKYNEEATLPGVEFRAVNAAYSESTGTFAQKSENIVDLGGDADVDLFIIKTRGDLNNQRAEQDRMKVKAISYKFQDTFFNGDVAVDANSFDGLKKRLTGAQVIDAATNGLPIVGASSNDRQTFLDKLDETISSVDGGVDALYMRRAIIYKILSAARREGGADWITQSFFEETGNPTVKRIPTYNGIPMLDPGTKADGTDIIPQTETQGSSSAASSIYAVRFGNDLGDRAVTGLNNGGVDVRDLGEQDSKPVMRTRVQFFCGLALFGSKGAARLRGVLNS